MNARTALHDLHIRPLHHTPAFGRVREALAGIAGFVAERRRRRQVLGELAGFSDRELADIGLTRYDVGQIFDPRFVATHRAGL